ncbi:MAG: hypothetical protein EHM42_02970 [Planctomycetaceae bacterium]|nr:MAG: hypothetical protein EHM42_02970 [Planctomycetaceae bacterium]
MGSPPPVPQEQIDARRTRQASEQYFTAVNTLIDDLSSKNARATNYERTAAWHDSYASKIDSLSLRNVDPELADYGKLVGQRLRAVGASSRGVSLRLNTAQNEFVVDYSVDPGQFGGWGPGMFMGGAAMYSPPTWRATSNLQQVREKQARAVEEGAEQREQIWQTITDSRQKARQQMYSKFGKDFGGGR